MSYGSAGKRDMQQLRKRLEAQGWTVSLTRSNHYRATAPCGGTVFMPATPSKGRSYLNVRAKVKRLGAAV
jgi:N-acetylmuramoyl-L-alanine amidase